MVYKCNKHACEYCQSGKCVNSYCFDECNSIHINSVNNHKHIKKSIKELNKHENL